LDPQEELKELFYGMVGFFNEPSPSAAQLEEFKAAAENPSLDVAIYQVIIHFNQ